MTPAINAIVHSFRLRTMSYRHYKNVRDALRRSREACAADGILTGGRRVWHADDNALDVAAYYHDALAVPLERTDVYARPGRGAR